MENASQTSDLVAAEAPNDLKLANKGKLDRRATRALNFLNMKPSERVHDLIWTHECNWWNFRRCDRKEGQCLHDIGEVISKLLEFKIHVENTVLMYEEYLSEKGKAIDFNFKFYDAGYIDYDIYETIYDRINNNAIFYLIPGAFQRLDELLFAIMNFWEGFYIKLLIVMVFEVRWKEDREYMKGFPRHKKYTQAIQCKGGYAPRFRKSMREQYQTILDSDYTKRYGLTPEQKETATMELDQFKLIKFKFYPWTHAKKYQSDYDSDTDYGSDLGKDVNDSDSE